MLALATGASPRVGESQPSGVLRLLDSVRVVESDSFLLGSTSRLHYARAHYFVADVREGRIVELTKSGRLVRFIGRKGSGPGELRQPASLASSGDTLLGAWDLAQRRVVTWDLRTGRHRSTVSLGGWFPQLRFDKGQLRVAVLQSDSGAAMVTMSVDGERRVTEGVIPELLKRSPALVNGFGGVFAADDGEDAYAFFEVSNQLFQWRRGSRTATATDIPRRLRRGVRTDLFDEILKDPTKAASAAFDRSVPVVLHHSRQDALRS